MGEKETDRERQKRRRRFFSLVFLAGGRRKESLRLSLSLSLLRACGCDPSGLPPLSLSLPLVCALVAGRGGAREDTPSERGRAQRRGRGEREWRGSGKRRRRDARRDRLPADGAGPCVLCVSLCAVRARALSLCHVYVDCCCCRYLVLTLLALVIVAAAGAGENGKPSGRLT